MALNFEQKQAIVKELSGIASRSVSVLAGEYRGLSAGALNALRKTARESGVVMCVYRNTLVRRAVRETPYACLDKVLTGPVVLLFSQEEPGAAARVISKFIKDNELFQVRGMALGGQLYLADKLKDIASLPSRQEALGLLVAVMAAPITQFVRTLNEPVAQVARVMAAIGNQKKAA